MEIENIDDITQVGNSDLGDKETQEILSEIEAEKGDKSQTPNDTSKESKTEGEKKEDDGKPSDDSGEDDDEEDDDDESDEDSDDDTSDDDDDSEEDDDDSDDDEKGKKKLVPASKVAKQSKVIRELRRQLSEANARFTDSGQGKEGEEQLAGELEEIAKKHNADPELITDLAKVLRKGIGLPPDMLKGLSVLAEQAEDANQEKHAIKAFNKDILPLVENEYPDATPEQLNKIKRKFVKIALDPEHLGVKDLKVLYKGLDAFRNAVPSEKKTGESNSGKTTRTARKTGQSVDISNPESLDWDNMSDEEFDQASSALAKKSGSDLEITD